MPIGSLFDGDAAGSDSALGKGSVRTEISGSGCATAISAGIDFCCVARPLVVAAALAGLAGVGFVAVERGWRGGCLIVAAVGRSGASGARAAVSTGMRGAARGTSSSTLDG